MSLLANVEYHVAYIGLKDLERNAYSLGVGANRGCVLLFKSQIEHYSANIELVL